MYVWNGLMKPHSLLTRRPLSPVWLAVVSRIQFYVCSLAVNQLPARSSNRKRMLMVLWSCKDISAQENIIINNGDPKILFRTDVTKLVESFRYLCLGFSDGCPFSVFLFFCAFEGELLNKGIFILVLIEFCFLSHRLSGYI
ncbi:hypothetical protein FGIG_06545 [Fasciola gigantica]|uniref:Uncharacterized protein n=1 Tax=Fasciola gigantica TaxID=46835 RepID=A0A504YU97_FASGI|nr:hypothetical protein FGIG_06545 [Fasciola gigantica]